MVQIAAMNNKQDPTIAIFMPDHFVHQWARRVSLRRSPWRERSPPAISRGS